MATITRWDPFREAFALQNRLNSIFTGYGQSEADALSAANFAPPVDIYEDESKLVLKLEVPGIQESDLDIQVENRTLTVRGERKFDREEKQENFHRVEHRYGTFARTFTLPSTVDPESIQASYDAGVLKLELQKKAQAKPRQIKVNTGGQQQGQPSQVEAASQQPQGVQSQTAQSQPEAGKTAA